MLLLFLWEKSRSIFFLTYHPIIPVFPFHSLWTAPLILTLGLITTLHFDSLGSLFSAAPRFYYIWFLLIDSCVWMIDPIGFTKCLLFFDNQMDGFFLMLSLSALSPTMSSFLFLCYEHFLNMFMERTIKLPLTKIYILVQLKYFPYWVTYSCIKFWAILA